MLRAAKLATVATAIRPSRGLFLPFCLTYSSVMHCLTIQLAGPRPRRTHRHCAASAGVECAFGFCCSLDAVSLLRPALPR